MTAEKLYRLPATVTPERYQLRLTPDLRTWTFAGEVKISIRVHEPAREIVLNAAELEVHSASVRLADGRVLPCGISLDAQNERATLSFAEIVPPGASELQIQFS